jgi:hypothetical protein
MIAALLLVSTQRLPAPIQEVPESPTPKPEQSAKPKQPKAQTTEAPPKTKPTPKPSATPARPMFAGTWKGILTGSANGATATIVVSPGEDSAVVTGLSVWRERRGRTTISGHSISWKFLAESWVMTVAPDGKTATVTGHHWPAGSSTGTLERVR